VIRRFFRDLAQGLAEMKKTSSKRASGYEAGLGSAVLDAPKESYARETEARSLWQGRGPAPAGALQRGYGSDEYEGAAAPGYGMDDEPEYVPRRGNFRVRFRGIPKGIAGRIVFGVVVFAVLGAIVVAFAEVRSYLLHDPRFIVATSDDIQITGAEHLTRAQVLSVFGADLERDIFRVSLPERKADLERLPWVAHATVMRLLPNIIRVQITERTPIAFVRQGTQIGLVDASGVLLDMPPDAAGDPHYSFPVLTGLSADLPLDTRAARMEVYAQFMTELRSADQHLTDSLSEVDISDPEDVKALIASGSSDILVHFGKEDFLKRYHEFEQNLPGWKQQYPNLASADMRYEGQVVLEMQNGAGVTPALDGSPSAPVAARVAPVMKHPAAVTAKPLARVTPSSLKLVGANETKPVPAKPVAAKPAASKAPAKKVLAKTASGPKSAVTKPGAKKKVGAGMSAANEKEFAALAAAHKAALAKSAKSGGMKSAGGVTP
jgi:cell division protein FtsQ